jgi:hypothetical protein
MGALTTARVSEMVGGSSAAHGAQISSLVSLAEAGLPQMFDETRNGFPWTLRGVATLDGPTVRREGGELMYDAIVVLGAACLDEDRQRLVLGGSTAREFSVELARRAVGHAHLGAVALCAWAAAEVASHYEPELFERWERELASGRGQETVYVAWALTAAVAAGQLGPTEAVRSAALNGLIASQGERGIFSKYLPVGSGPAWRRHVGCFADQVYPIQALARHHVDRPDPRALSAAEACARRICELQGPAGQWWWHYDQRTGGVVERFPVYSVHQHSMAPMALMELLEAGGQDHRDAVARGLGWLDLHPEVFVELVDPRFNVVWRRVGRREPRRLSRGIKAIGTASVPGLELAGLDRLLPPTSVDYECRPYELGWILYAWLAEPLARGALKAVAESAPSLPDTR